MNMDNKKSIVSVIKCTNYNYKEIKQAIEQSIANIGGLRQFIDNSTKVLIKPNLLSAKPPEKAVTTHPAIVRAVVELIQEIGARVMIGDSPAGISRPIEEYWKATGLKEVSEQTGAELVVFEKKGVAERVVNGKSYFIAKPVAEADIIINLCKMKTHSLTLFTGAIKNMFGVIPGVKKGEYHKIAPKVNKFSEILVDVFETVKPVISIMDAVLAMEGNGPSSGSPRKVGIILASTDAVALDAVAAHIIGFQPEDILTTRIAHQRGLGKRELEQIEIRGEDLGDVEDLNIQLPTNRIYQLVPEFLMKMVGQLVWVRPRAKPDVCKKCGLCIQNCPVKAMKSINGIPDIDYDVCIKCFCCDEVCPYNAIEQQMSWLAKKLS